MGWRAEVSAISKHGFPLTLNARLHDVSIADPATGVAVDAAQLDLIAAALWPGFMTVKLPETPIEITTAAGSVMLHANDAQADLLLHPGTSLQLQSMSAVSNAWQVSVAKGSILSADDLRVAVIQDGTTPETYQFNVDVSNLTPGTLTRAAIALPVDWPASFDAFTADVSVTFDMPWDRTALASRRPQPRAVTLRRLKATWGDLNILVTGKVAIDPKGIPTGTLSLALTNWSRIINWAEISGALPVAQRQQAEIMLSALSNLGGSPNDLDLTLSLQEGEMSLGSIRLGPAPRLILR